MSTLIEELQRDALDQSVSVTELLQKCLVVATKLEVGEFAEWTRLELDGYKEKEVPGYRVVHGDPQVFNPYRGYQPLFFNDLRQAELVSKMHFNQPIGELEYDLKHAENVGSHSFQISYHLSVEKALMNGIKYGVRPSLQISASQFRKILDAVRNVVLEWSLKLENDGIIGTGMSFSGKEKEKAKSITYHIKNYFQGDVDHSQIQIETAKSTQNQSNTEMNIPQLRKVIKALESSLDKLPLDDEAKKELLAEIQTLESQSNSPKPKDSILRTSLGAVQRILEGAVGSLIASGLLNQIGSLF